MCKYKEKFKVIAKTDCKGSFKKGEVFTVYHVKTTKLNPEGLFLIYCGIGYKSFGYWTSNYFKPLEE